MSIACTLTFSEVAQCAKKRQTALNLEKMILLSCKDQLRVELQSVTAGGGLHRQ